MPRHRKFTQRKTPQYLVLTKCQPEAIDGISLKFRDLHVTYGIMFDHTDGFVRAIEAEQQRHERYLEMAAPLPESARKLQDLIRLMFSAHLSTYETIIYYLREALTTDGKTWLDDLQKADEPLNAFDRLRNRDIHHEPIHTLIGTRFRISAVEPLHSSLETKDVHFHQTLLHEGVGFYPPPVAATQQFAGNPGLVDFVTFESVLQLSHRVIHRVADLLNEAVQLGHWAGTGTPFECGLCEAPKPEPQR